MHCWRWPGWGQGDWIVAMGSGEHSGDSSVPSWDLHPGSIPFTKSAQDLDPMA